MTTEQSDRPPTNPPSDGAEWPVVVLAAKEVEIEPLVRRFSTGTRTAAPGVVFWSGSAGGYPVVLAYCGSGKVNATLATASLLHSVGSRAVLSIGSCGAVAAGVGAGDIVVSCRVYPHDYGAWRGGTFRRQATVSLLVDGQEQRHRWFGHANGESSSQAADLLRRDGWRVVEGSLASGDVFLADASQRDTLARAYGAIAVDMMSVGVAATCQAAGVPWLSIRSCSDHADADASDTYVDHHRGAAERAAGAAECLLRKGMDILRSAQTKEP